MTPDLAVWVMQSYVAVKIWYVMDYMPPKGQFYQTLSSVISHSYSVIYSWSKVPSYHNIA